MELSMTLGTDNNKEFWFSSKETQKHLKVTGCELMHLREKGKLEFEKRGNADFYKIDANKLMMLSND